MQISSYLVLVTWDPDKRSRQGQANDDNEQHPCFQKPASGVAMMDVSVMASCQMSGETPSEQRRHG
jgi:hypothetical protein